VQRRARTPGLAAYEKAVRETGRDYTILRPSGFDSNALGRAESIRKQRMVFAPYGDVAWPSSALVGRPR